MKTTLHKQITGLCLLCMTALVACNNNEDINDIIEPDPWKAQLTISEVKQSDGGTVTYNEVYNYSDFVFMTSCYTEQKVLDFELKNNYSIDYDFNNRKYTYTDELGNTWEYIHDQWGLTHQGRFYSTGGEERTYLFKYYGEHLAQLDEYIDDKLNASAKFEYIDDYNTKLTTVVNGQTEVLHIKYSDEIIWNAFPNYFLTEIYPLNTQRLAYYNGLFGVNFRVIKEMQYEGSDEVTTFTYNNMPGSIIMPDFCTQTISYGNEAPFKRTVNYTLTPIE